MGRCPPRALAAVVAAMLALAAAHAGAGAQDLPAWQAAQRIQERLFAAQSALLLGEPTAAESARAR